MDRKNCSNCWHDSGIHCRVASSNCATAVLNREEEPPRWMSAQEGWGIEQIFIAKAMMKGGESNGD